MKRKAQMPNMEELISRISRKISEGEDGEVLATKLDFDYAYGQIKLDDDTKKPVHIYCHRRQFHWILPFLERLLWTGGHSNSSPKTDRYDTRTQTPSLVRRYNNCHQRKLGKTRNGSTRNNDETGKSRI